MSYSYNLSIIIATFVFEMRQKGEKIKWKMEVHFMAMKIF